MIPFKMLHSWSNLFGLMFKHNQSDFCMQLFSVVSRLFLIQLGVQNVRGVFIVIVLICLGR